MATEDKVGGVLTDQGTIVLDRQPALPPGPVVVVLQAVAHPPKTGSDQARFQDLVQRWKKDTAHQSNVAKRAMHPAYQEIVGMGPPAVALLLAELRRDPDDWFWALHAITGANPIPETSRGHLQAMVAAWLEWGAANGYQA